VLLGVVAVAAGCATGPRPHFATTNAAVGGATGTPTGDAGADRVLALLESNKPPTFTATYRIERKLGPNNTTGTVVKDGTELSVTVGDVRFLSGGHDLTCSLSRKTCENGTLDARISNYSIGSAFWSSAPARALRVAMSRRSGPAVPSTQRIGNVEAQCVDVPVGAGVEHYCASPQGAVARWDTAAVNVQLTSLAKAVDSAALRSPAP
jgi:hypothetical protein